MAGCAHWPLWTLPFRGKFTGVCTRWPEVAILRSTTSAAIIGCLRKIFAKHGLPGKGVTDNGANLASEEFENFLETQGIQHCKVTPYWPQKAKDQQAEQRMKAYVDKRNRASTSDIASGDKLLLKQARQNKLSTLYDPHPFTVLERRGPSLILQRGDGRMFMRNVSHVHKLHKDSRLHKEENYMWMLIFHKPLTLHGQRNKMWEDLLVSDVHQHIWRTISYEQLPAELMLNISKSFICEWACWFCLFITKCVTDYSWVFFLTSDQGRDLGFVWLYVIWYLDDVVEGIWEKHSWRYVKEC